LHFASPETPRLSLSLSALRRACSEREVEVEDPYYEREMRFLALPLSCVLERGFGTSAAALAAEDFSLRALDGYTRPSTGAQLAEPGAFLAFADASLSAAARVPFVARWAPIERRQLDPAPFYMVWNGEGQNDPHRYPWPFQLSVIERVPFEARHPHTVPTGVAADSQAAAGFALFRSQCIMCHAVNHEGGKVGPELNVPQSIIEYRSPEQLKAFIRNPQRFRYTSMPAHPQLSEGDLDALLAYFRAMSLRKYDPRAASASQSGSSE